MLNAGRWRQIETDRCYLRLPQVSDARAIVRYYTRNQEYLRPVEPVRPPEFFTEAWWREGVPAWHDEFSGDRAVRLIVIRRDDPSTVIGSVNFTNIVRGVFQACTLGFSLDQAQQGQGIMREALQAGIQYMFEERRLHRIMANYMPRNAPSAALLKRLGFVIEGSGRDYVRIAGKWEDHVLTSLVNPEWTPVD